MKKGTKKTCTCGEDEFQRAANESLRELESFAGSQVSAEVKEEAQKALNYICNELGNLNEHTGQDVGIETQLPIAKSVLQKFIDNSIPKEEKEEWISVATPPKEDEWVLLYNGHWRGVGKYKPNEDDEFPEPSWINETNEYISPEPTHWMPLPAPPKEAGQNDKM